ncbi:MAG: barstar family protein [Sutterellaceae bacterium]|nr:barstar family protein [Burkholderiaceae bacterium]MCX7901231.1 barstar family protein [Burkholderiaceae bacterium]MDW8429191.1 barstar family protein [Sutterellaceae bacterium]
MRRPTCLADLPSNAVRPLGTLAVDTLRAWAEAAQHRFVHVPLAGTHGKRAVLVAIGRAFDFPVWFGANLDALYDSLTDLPERASAPGYVVVLDGLPQAADAEEVEAVLDVFRDAAEEFANRGLPLRVFFR